MAEILVDESPDALFAATTEGIILSWNRGAQETFGFGRKEAVGSSLFDLLIPADSDRRQEVCQAYKEALDIGFASIETIGQKNNGSRIHVAASLRSVREDKGPVQFVATSFRDITSLRRLRDERASGTRVRALLDAAPDAMVIVGKNGRIVLVNSQTERLFGYKREELLGQPIEILVPDRYRALHPDHRSAYFDDPRPRPMGMGLDLLGRRKDGTEFPVEISLSPIETEEGLFVSSAIRDVSERKKAEETRVRLAAIVDSSDDAIISNTLEGIITSWNRGAERIFGYSREEALGKPISVLVPPDRQEEEPEIVERLGRGERIEHFETVRRRKDGQEINVSVAVSPIRDAYGNVVGASKVAREITERKRAEEALAQAKEAAEEANRELEAFSYSVAHDLRTPLRSIDGFSHALLEDYSDKLDEEGKNYLQTVRDSAEYMAELIDDLLMLARVTRGELRRERVDLSGLARTVAARLQNAQPQRQVEFIITNELEVIGDSRLLGILFDNLLGNAWKFTGKQAKARIEFGCSEGGEQSVYFVRDNGAGFDMAYSPKLFGVFQRLHLATEFEGTGIGLATAQRIIRRHGGRIWAEGEVDRGATFYFTLNERTEWI